MSREGKGMDLGGVGILKRKEKLYTSWDHPMYKALSWLLKGFHCISSGALCLTWVFLVHFGWSEIASDLGQSSCFRFSSSGVTGRCHQRVFFWSKYFDTICEKCRSEVQIKHCGSLGAVKIVSSKKTWKHSEKRWHLIGALTHEQI